MIIILFYLYYSLFGRGLVITTVLYFIILFLLCWNYILPLTEYIINAKCPTYTLFRVHFSISPEYTFMIIFNHATLILDEHSPYNVLLFRTVGCEYLPYIYNVITIPYAFTFATMTFRIIV